MSSISYYREVEPSRRDSSYSSGSSSRFYNPSRSLTFSPAEEAERRQTRLTASQRLSECANRRAYVPETLSGGEHLVAGSGVSLLPPPSLPTHSVRADALTLSATAEGRKEARAAATSDLRCARMRAAGESHFSVDYSAAAAAATTYAPAPTPDGARLRARDSLWGSSIGSADAWERAKGRADGAQRPADVWRPGQGGDAVERAHVRRGAGAPARRDYDIVAPQCPNNYLLY